MLSINLKKQRGVALLYAVLLVSIVLTISLSLLNITYKQIILTAVNRESQIAHFTALSALDCVYYTDLRYRNNDGVNNVDNPFGYFTFDFTTNTYNLHKPTSPPASFSCPTSVGGMITVDEVVQAAANPTNIGVSATGIKSIYKMSGSGLVGSCATVEVVKVLSGDYDDFGEGAGITDERLAMVSSLGYNTCDQSNSRRVERRAREYRSTS